MDYLPPSPSHVPTSTVVPATETMYRLTAANVIDLEMVGSTILKGNHHSRQRGDAVVLTTVSGRLVSADALVLEVYPFVVRTSLTATQTDMSDWVGAVRDELVAGIHPAPCALYARRASKGVDAVTQLFANVVFSTAKTLLDVTPFVSTTAPLLPSLHYVLSLSVTYTYCTADTSQFPTQGELQNQQDDIKRKMNGDGYDDMQLRRPLSERVYALVMQHRSSNVCPALLTRKLLEACIVSEETLQALLEDPDGIMMLVHAMETSMQDEIGSAIDPSLSAAACVQSNQVLGQQLYDKIQCIGSGDLAGKITGMLLELPHNEVMELLANPNALRARVVEAQGVLISYAQAQAGGHPRRRPRR